MTFVQKDKTAMLDLEIDSNLYYSRDETHHPPLLTRLGSTGLVKKANVVGENEPRQ